MRVIRQSRLKLSLSTLALWLTACTQLPVSGPNHYVVDREAKVTLARADRSAVVDYVLLEIDRNVLDHVVHVGPDSLFRTFGDRREGPPLVRPGIGDAVTVSIFEASSGGLFTSTDVGTRTGSYVTLPVQNVDDSGNITVPYAGTIRAVGRPLASIQRDIERRLSNRAIEPQVVISVPQSGASEVAVFGDAVSSSVKARINSGGESVLDVIARAGLRYPGHEVFITLQRSGRRATIYFPRLLEAPSENIFVRPGDVLYVYRNPQQYIAVGALSSVSQTTGLTGLYTFGAARVSLAEAIAKAGGLLDDRANAGQVLLYRLEMRSVLERSGVQLDGFPAGQEYIPTVYRANYRDPSVFFFANEFPIRNRDVIYVANADSVEVSKFLGYVRTVTNTVTGVSTDAVVTRDAVRALRN